MAWAGASKCAWPNGEDSSMLRTAPSVSADPIIGSHMERHAHRVGIPAAVVQTGHKRDNRLLWDDKPKAQLGRDRGAAVSFHLLPTPTLPAPRHPGSAYMTRLAGNWSAYGGGR